MRSGSAPNSRSSLPCHGSIRALHQYLSQEVLPLDWLRSLPSAPRPRAAHTLADDWACEARRYREFFPDPSSHWGLHAQSESAHPARRLSSAQWHRHRDQLRRFVLAQQRRLVREEALSLRGLSPQEDDEHPRDRRRIHRFHKRYQLAGQPTHPRRSGFLGGRVLPLPSHESTQKYVPL